MQSLSILIPVLNEAAKIPELIEKLKTYPTTIPIIICDGGSQDDTLHLLQSLKGDLSFEVIHEKLPSPSIMGTLSLGLTTLRSEFVMIHPVDVDAKFLLKELNPSKFKNYDYIVPYKRYDSSHIILKIQEFLLNNLRLSLKKSFVWTNCPIVKTDLLRKLAIKPAGFLEDVILSDELAKLSTPLVIKTAVVVSSRRYQKDGTLGRFLGNAYIMFLFRFKLASIEKLKKMYLQK